MKRAGKSKVTKLSAKAGAVYPLIRLPKTFADEIGKVAEIFETQNCGRRVLIITFNDKAKSSKIVKYDPEVIQLLPEFIQPDESKLIS